MSREIFVPGVPAAQGSKRFVGRGGGKGVMVESSKALKPWRATIVGLLHDAGWHHDPLLVGPVRLVLVFKFPRPQYHYGTGRNAGLLRAAAPFWHDKKPDASKLQRAVEDALTDAGVIRDDCQIAQWSGAKEYATAPGVLIRVEPITEENHHV